MAKQPGDPLTGGSVNRGNPLLMRVERVGLNFHLSSIVRLLDKAMAENPALHCWPTGSGWFVAALLGIAALTAGGWYLADPGQHSGSRLPFWSSAVPAPCHWPLLLHWLPPPASWPAMGYW